MSRGFGNDCAPLQHCCCNADCICSSEAERFGTKVVVREGMGIRLAPSRNGIGIGSSDIGGMQNSRMLCITANMVPAALRAKEGDVLIANSAKRDAFRDLHVRLVPDLIDADRAKQ